MRRTAYIVGIRDARGAAFFDANTVITTDGADGLHLTAEAEKKLGTAVAAKVQQSMTPRRGIS